MKVSNIGVEACLNCSRYISCTDKKKSFSYVCNKYKPVRYEEISKALEHSDKKPKNLDALMIDDEARSEFNVRQIVDQVLNDKSIVPVDVKMNDRHIPKAKNFYEFCVGEEFLDIKPFVEQCVIGTILNAEYCPRCTDMDWLLEGHKVDDTLRKFTKKVALLENGECPYCVLPKSKFVAKQKLNYYQELIAICGQRSGKSAVTAMLSAYHIHRLVKLSKPNEVYGLLHSNVLHINFVAMSFQGAKNLLYDPLYGYLIDAPWFQTYHEFLQSYERKTGEVVHKLNDTFLMYRHRALIVAPLGPDRRALRGKTRFGCAIDEICHFPNDKSEAVKMNASEVYIALERSLLTIRSSANKLLAKGFNDIPTGMFWNISSPYSVRDKGMEVYRASQNSTKIYGIQKPTWEMNPTVTYEDLKSEFDKDPVTAMRDYGAQPPLQSNAFIQSNEHVAQLIGKKQNAIIYTMAQKRYKNGDTERFAKVKNIKEINYPSILAIDAGVVNNSFSAVCAHYDEENDTIVATTIVECIPFPGIPINFTLMYNNIICSIIESQNVVLLCADRWNSIKILSDARQQFNIEVEQYSLKYKDMWFVRDYITENRLILPRIDKKVEDCVEYDIDDYPYAFDGKPIEHLVLQMLTVRDTGSSVIKGDGNLTDDTFRALCLAVHRIREEKYSHLFVGDGGEESERSNTQLAVVKGMSNTAVVGSISITGTSGKTIAVARRSRN